LLLLFWATYLFVWPLQLTEIWENYPICSLFLWLWQVCTVNHIKSWDPNTGLVRCLSGPLFPLLLAMVVLFFLLKKPKNL
jgi:hypothetical protein